MSVSVTLSWSWSAHVTATVCDLSKGKKGCTEDEKKSKLLDVCLHATAFVRDTSKSKKRCREDEKESKDT